MNKVCAHFAFFMLCLPGLLLGATNFFAQNEKINDILHKSQIALENSPEWIQQQEKLDRGVKVLHF